MPNLLALLDGYEGDFNPSAIQKHVNNKAKEMGYSILFSDGDKNQYIPKSRFDQVNTEKNNLQSQVDLLQPQVTNLQTQLSTAQGSAKSTAMGYAIEAMASKYSALDESGEDLLKFLDTESLTLGNDGKITGLEDAVKKLREDKGYLFKPEAPQGGAPNLGVPNLQGTGTPGRPVSGAQVGGGQQENPGEIGRTISQLYGKGSRGNSTITHTTQSSPGVQSNIDSNYFFNQGRVL